MFNRLKYYLLLVAENTAWDIGTMADKSENDATDLIDKKLPVDGKGDTVSDSEDEEDAACLKSAYSVTDLLDELDDSEVYEDASDGNKAKETRTEDGETESKSGKCEDVGENAGTAEEETVSNEIDDGASPNVNTEFESNAADKPTDDLTVIAKTKNVDIVKDSSISDSANADDTTGADDTASASDTTGADDTASASDTTGADDTASASDTTGADDTASASDTTGADDTASASDTTGNDKTRNDVEKQPSDASVPSGDTTMNDLTESTMTIESGMPDSNCGDNETTEDNEAADVKLTEGKEVDNTLRKDDNEELSAGTEDAAASSDGASNNLQEMDCDQIYTNADALLRRKHTSHLSSGRDLSAPKTDDADTVEVCADIAGRFVVSPGTGGSEGTDSLDRQIMYDEGNKTVPVSSDDLLDTRPYSNIEYENAGKSPSLFKGTKSDNFYCRIIINYIPSLTSYKLYTQSNIL